MPTPKTSSTTPALCALLASVLALAPTAALAEPPPPPPANPSAEQLERAKELFENGKGLYREGSYDTAIAAFKSAYAQSGDPVLLYNIALAYDRANDFDAALEYLEYYRAFAPESERQSLAEKEDSLRKRRLRAQTESPQEPVPSTEEEPPEEQPAPRSVAPPPSTPSDDDSKEPTEKPPLFTTPVWVLSSIAVVGVGVGAGLGIASLRTSSNAEAACSMGDGDPICPTSARSDADRAKQFGLGADIAFGVGAVAGVVAISVLISNAVKRKKNTTTALIPSRGGAGISVRF